MLKRLELVGFKSFADKTVFDFPPGITAVVGPNGSGKSNIVDAVRWVLGEQSAKSLRGGEMVDVIFNGSASRRSLGMAEVTMTLDNSRGHLATDAEEIQISRRVYRSGEGEYLINQQVCRLKDIKDLLLGSGAGAGAYSIIEQGRVDSLLQASTKERRIIFEEAAGISRFKAKKIETLRKLERVEANLARLRDIIEEVEKQLRSVKLQAAKAGRYREYSERLRQLRIDVGLREYGELAQRLATETVAHQQLRSSLEEQLTQADASERELHDLEATIARLDEAISTSEVDLATAQQQIASEETTLGREWNLCQSLEHDLAQTQRQLVVLNQHAASLEQAAREAAAEVALVQDQCDAQQEGVEQLLGQVGENETRLGELGRLGDELKQEHMECMRQTARLQNDAVSFKAQVDNLTREHNRLRQKTEQAAEHLASIDLELQELTQAETALHDRLTASRESLADLRRRRETIAQEQDRTVHAAGDLRARRSGLASRIEILEGLERGHEGLGAGLREVFDLLEQPDVGPWRTVLGLVADFLTVRREYAPLIDLALGQQAERFLVGDMELLHKALAQRKQPFTSRVSFLPASATGPLPPTADITPEEAINAASVVRTEDADLADLPRRLLASTWIVADLITARRLAASHPGCRFVTAQGELLEADGSLIVGTHHAETGIISRKSELRELREQSIEVETRLAEIEIELAGYRTKLSELDGQVENQRVEIDVLAEQLTDLRARIGQHRQRREGLEEEVVVSQTEISGLEQEIARLQDSWQQAREEARQAEARVQEIQERLQAIDRESRERQEHRQQVQQQATAARVALAQVEERLASLRERQRRLDADVARRQEERAEKESHLTQTQTRWQHNQCSLLEAYAALATGCWRKEQAERFLSTHTLEREKHRVRRQHLLERSQATRSSWRGLQEQAHARELEVNNLQHAIDTLCARLQEDYQIDLKALHEAGEEGRRGGGKEERREEGEVEGIESDEGILPPPLLPSSPPPLSAQEEIEDLKKKLARLGSVNLDALEELNVLEARAQTLQIQHDDLVSAEKTLQDIISRINVDSRRLFTETFEAVRGHFQELFRKLFGGGQADVILEDEADVLESGIEIIARPPGKELRSISLLSGGEKTLAAAALLLAIFRSKPSPFCILDEVDAALDEGNIGRFTAVLRDFLDRSQFIIITHSKRTMAFADVLYGVTMQESGISRRMSIRFEDWADEEQQQDEPAA